MKALLPGDDELATLMTLEEGFDLTEADDRYAEINPYEARAGR